MKYPLDNYAIEEITKDLLLSHREQNQVIGQLISFLIEAMQSCEDEDDWYKETNEYLKRLNKRAMDFESHRFNQKNGHNIDKISPYNESNVSASQASLTVNPSISLDESQLDLSNSSSGEMTEEELELIFRDAKGVKKKKLKKMSLEEIEEWEKQQNNSNDIYKVSARIKNLARAAIKGNLTAQGNMVVNMFTHMIKDIYDFAETIQDKETKIRLTELARKQEELPGSLLVALIGGVHTQK